MIRHWSRPLSVLVVAQVLLGPPAFADDDVRDRFRPILIDEDDPRRRSDRTEEGHAGRFPPEQHIAAPPDVAFPPLDAETTIGGVTHKLVLAGNDEEPARINDTVLIHYTGWTSDGAMFDTTEIGGEPVRYSVGKMMPGLSQGLLHMVEGETRRMWIPQELAFDGRPGTPQGTVVFDVTLVSIEERGLLPPPDVAGVPDDALVLDSGLAYRVLEPGSGGESPSGDDAVRVHFTVFYTDGRLVDDTRQRAPASFTLDTTIPGFREALPLMVRGEKARLWIPEELANIGNPPLYEGMLVFDLELLEFCSRPVVPPDVSGIPPEATRTESGLAFKILQPGNGDRHPRLNDTIVVHFAGWTRDGTRFDSSYDQGGAGELVLNHKKPLGFNQALQMMVVGEKRRFWIPPELGYGEGEGRPQGMLIFEVELLEIKDRSIPAAPSRR